jgi:hypothetical protein
MAAVSGLEVYSVETAVRTAPTSEAYAFRFFRKCLLN